MMGDYIGTVCNHSGRIYNNDAAILEFLVLTLFLIPLSKNDEFTITWADLGIGMAAGMLMCLGRIFVTIGVAVGLAGPAEALMSTHALY